MPKVKVSVQQDPEKPVEKNILAQAIVDIAGAMKKLLASGLNEQAIVTLVAGKTGFGHGTIRTVMQAMSHLERDYCR